VVRGVFMGYTLHPHSTSPPHPSAKPFPIQESSPYWLHCSGCPSGLFSPNTLHKPLTAALLSPSWWRGIAMALQACGHSRALGTKDTQEVTTPTQSPAWHQNRL